MSKANKIIKRRNNCRQAKAFTLVSMFMLALVVSLTIGGMGVALIPHFRSTATDGLADLQTSTLLESASNYVQALLCDPDSRSYYDVTKANPLRVIDISPAQLGIASPTAENIKGIKVIVQYQSPTPETLPAGTSELYFPIAYDSKFDPLSSDAFKVVGTTNFWRTLTVLVNYGTNGAKPYWSGSVVALKPFIQASSSGDGRFLPPDSSIFDAAAFGRNTLSLDANSATTSFSDPLLKTPIPDAAGLGFVGGDVGAGKGISLGNNARIGGKVQLNTIATVDIGLGTGSNINEIIQYNGATPTTNGTSTLPTGAVSQRSATGTYPAPVASDTSLIINDVPNLAAPDGTTNFNLASLTAPPAGDYVIDSSQLSSANLSNLPNPIRLFVESSSTSDKALNLTQNLGNSSAPGNLQIFYNGTRPLNFSGTQVSALIFAPSARVTFGTSAGVTTTLNGSVKASDVALLGQSQINFYNATKNPNFPGVGYNFEDLKIAQASGTNSLRWEVQSVKELNYAEFLAASQLAP